MMSYRVVVIGAVRSTEVTLRALVRNGLEVVGVLGHEPGDRSAVAGWVDLRRLAGELGLPFRGFLSVNDPDNVRWASALKPDLIFAVGFSQLLEESWLDLPRLGCIGFHPTALPHGRGRAPLAWTVLEMKPGAATFFLMGRGADDGPIFDQVPFRLVEEDDASSVLAKVVEAIDVCLDRWLPELKRGAWNPQPQDERLASWYGRRCPEDGLIDWSHASGAIERLVKASTHPHPGAYSYLGDAKLVIWSAEAECRLPIRGVTGRVLRRDSSGRLLVQCGDGHLWIKEFELVPDGGRGVRVGDKLGYSVQDEINRLRMEVAMLKGLVPNG
jgi:methionyl-tRNA formyltransferase